MTELVGLIEWSFASFWRWAGFAFLLSVVFGGLRGALAAFLVAFARKSK